nr:phosphoribosylaminoimidazole carboxylase [Quercus suber]
MAAAHTTLPVIGIPVKPSVGDGTDSVLSILNMPRGVPVATVSVNNSVNAALLAARMLGVADAGIRARVEAYMRDAAAEVRGKDARLVELGPERYLADVLGKR